MPPMNIKVRDNRSFGRKPVVGLCSLKSLHRYRREPRDHIDGQDVQGKFVVARCVIHFFHHPQYIKLCSRFSTPRETWITRLGNQGGEKEKGFV